MTISLPRRLLRSFLAVLRRGGLARHLQRTGLWLVADGRSVCLWAADPQQAVEYRHVTYTPETQLAIDFELLVACAGRTDEPVHLTLRPDGSIEARWQHGPVPQHRVFTPPSAETTPCPDRPPYWSLPDARLPAALKEAVSTCDPSSSRYALDCVQFRGDHGELVASDGRQALIQEGFEFRWSDDSLAHGTKLWTAAEIVGADYARVGVTDSHIAVRAGAWTTWSKLETEGRYPDVSLVVPAAGNPNSTRLRLDPTEAEFLCEGLDGMPGAKSANRAVTVELNGHVAVRACGDDGGQAVVLRLPASTTEGPAVEAATNREHLRRALKLGFTEVDIAGRRGPAVCRNEHMTYVWGLLEPDVDRPEDGEVAVVTPPSRTAVAAAAS